MTPLERMNRWEAQLYMDRRVSELSLRMFDLGELSEDDPTYPTVRSRAEKADKALYAAVTWLVEKACPLPTATGGVTSGEFLSVFDNQT
jgi:hypothetical protein